VSRNQKSRHLTQSRKNRMLSFRPLRPSSGLTPGEIFLRFPFPTGGENLFLPAAKQIA
jgi:hypothetical protein